MSQPPQASQTAQPSHPTLINLPQPPSNPETPSEMPGTPTSTTTSLSALSTTAIKDGHRGHPQYTGTHRGHQHHASTTSLEAERADRISRLTGLSNLLTAQRGPGGFGSQNNQSPSAGFAAQAGNSQTTPTSGQFSAGSIAAPAPAYFDSNGQPVASTKISTVGTASATSSGDGRTTTLGDGDGDATMLDDVDGDEDVRSVDTNLLPNDSASVGAHSAPGGRRLPHHLHRDSSGRSGDALDPMDEDLLDRDGRRFFDDDRMSEGSEGDEEDRDGTASLVGFGEGAGSTVSGPIYHRRPVPGTSSAGAMAFARWQLERSTSGLSDGSSRDYNEGRGLAAFAPVAHPSRDPRSMPPRPSSAAVSASGGVGGGASAFPPDLATGSGAAATTGGGDRPVSASASQERRQARMVDGVATDGAGRAGVAAPEDDDVFVDTTTRSPVPVVSDRRGKKPHQRQIQQSHQQLRQATTLPPSPTREAVERIVQRLDGGESRAAGDPVPAMSAASPGSNGDKLGKFYFE